MASERLPWRTLAVLALGAVAVRLGYLVAFARDYTPRSDANHYQAIAAAFANGNGISAPFPFTYLHPTAFRPPLFPAVLGAVGIPAALLIALLLMPRRTEEPQPDLRHSA